ncbi:MAG: hypothetical protein ACPGC1_11685 [Pseudomonadales bacterium]
MNHMPTLRLSCTILLTMVLSLFGPVAYGEESTELPYWLTPSLAEKIISIEMTQQQRELFQASLAECLRNLRKDTEKVLRRGGADLEKKIARAQKRRFKAFEDTMLDALKENQQAAFKAYLAAQIEVLKEAFP